MSRSPITISMLVPIDQISAINEVVRSMDPNGINAISKATHGAKGAKDATHAVLELNLPEWRAKRFLTKLEADYKTGKLDQTAADFDSKAKGKLKAAGIEARFSGKNDDKIDRADLYKDVEKIDEKVDINVEALPSDKDIPKDIVQDEIKE